MKDKEEIGLETRKLDREVEQTQKKIVELVQRNRADFYQRVSLKHYSRVALERNNPTDKRIITFIVADSGFLEVGRRLPRWMSKLLFSQFFPNNWMKLTEFGARGGTHSWHPPIIYF